MKKVVMRNSELLREVADLVAKGEDVTIRVKGNSMLPFIHGGKDSVVLKYPDDIKDYDIVLAEVSEGVFVLHRIISIDGDVVTLMGDGNVKGCEKCRRDKVCAKAVSIIHDGRNSDCTSCGHLRKAKVWRRLLPVRRYLLAIYRRLI